MPKGEVGIVGAGVMGRVLALTLQRAGWQTCLFDEGSEEGSGACSYAAAGLLSPYVELDSAERSIARLGALSLELWPALLPETVFFERKGTVVLAHPNDESDLVRLAKKASEIASESVVQIQRTQLEALEPEIDARYLHGLYFPAEGQMDNRECLSALALEIGKAGGRLKFGRRVLNFSRGKIQTEEALETFSWVIDTRGLKAREDFPSLRGVRGELIHLFAPEVTLTRPVRVMHPRFPLYLAPRRNHRFIVGATSVESELESPIRVRSVLELLSAAFSVHSGFGEAEVIETVARCRPALPHHLPSIRYGEGFLQINGLYRHGFLISPALATLVASLMSRERPGEDFSELFQEVA
jgi:glycine oxidase